MASRLLAFFPTLFAATTALAFQPLVTDDTGTQGAGGHQIEFSFNADRESTGGDTAHLRSVPLVYTRGLTDTLDVFAGIQQMRIRSTLPDSNAEGLSNAVIGAKWRFYENEGSKTSLAVKPEVALPVSRSAEASGLGTGRTSYGLTLILTQELPFGALHANLGADRNRFRDTAANPDASIIRASLAPVWNVSDHWKLALDVGAARESAAGTRTRTRFAEIGTIYSPNADLDFAAGYIHQRDDADPRTTVRSLTLGVTWRFK